MLLFGGFDRKAVLTALIQLVENGYDTLTNLENMTLRDVTDIHKVLMSRKQEEALSKSMGTRDSRIGKTVQAWR